MADFPPAFENTLKFEDSIPSGKVTPEPSDWRCSNGHQFNKKLPGACPTCGSNDWTEIKFYARFGINSRAHPEMPENFWTDPADQAIKLAEQTELVAYWQPNMFGGVLSQDVANKLFDISISMGQKEAVILAQRACVALGKDVVVDALMGPHTLDAINSCAPGDLLNELRFLSVAAYHADEQSNPTLIQWDASYMRRARA